MPECLHCNVKKITVDFIGAYLSIFYLPVFSLLRGNRNLLAQCFKCQCQSKMIQYFSEFSIHFPVFQQCILDRIHLL